MLSAMIHPANFDYSMASSISTIFKREPEILNSQQALHKLTQVALSFWNSNSKALLSFTKSETCSVQTTLHALSFVSESIDLGQALQQAGLLQNFENQYLLAALVLDKITAITNNLHNKNDQIKFNPETIIILKAHLTNLLDSLNLITNKLQHSHLETATHIVLQISQPQLTQEKILYSALGQFQTIDMYTNNTTIKKNLKNYKFIIDSRDDGNSGYRAFLASIFMHGIDSHQKESVHHFEKLVHDTFFDLFMKHDQLFPKNIKSSIGHAIKKNLIEQLHAINRCKNMQQVMRLFNEQVLFDFYMITFLKYLILNYGYHHEEMHTMILTLHTSFENYQKSIIPWGNEMTDLECIMLTLATNTTVSILEQNNMQHAITLHQASPEYGISNLLFTQKHHYQIAVPKKYRPMNKTS